MTLPCLIEQYVSFRKALGEICVTNGRYLRAFGRSVCEIEISQVSAEQVRSFLDGVGPITSAWHIKHNALLGFYRWAQSRGHVTTVPLPKVLPQAPPSFVPYIYSHAELRRLLDAAGTYQRNRSCIEPATVRTLVLLLYGTGLRLREALRLRRADVDFEEALLTVVQTKFHKSRFVPFGPQLRTTLQQYQERRGATGSARSADSPFFSTRVGRALSQNTFEDIFRRLCIEADVERSDGARYQPRLHDLRHTFAVHRLLSWYRQGLDVQKLLPKLTVYLGHVYLSATQVYLRMTPELLSEANARFERYAATEVCHE